MAGTLRIRGDERVYARRHRDEHSVNGFVPRGTGYCTCMSNTSNQLAEAERHASTARSTVARAGLVGRAMLYVVFGLLAVDIARGSGGSSTTQGAIEDFAGGSYGRVLLVVLCLGLTALVVWKATQAIAGDPVEGSEASDRAEHAVKGLVYGGTLVAAVSVLIANWNGSSGSGSGSGGSSTEQEATATVLEWPAGQFLVIAVGLGVLAFGAYEIHHHGKETAFMQRLDTSSMSEETAHGVEVAGRVGYVAKGITAGIVGVFFVVAGLQHDPDEAKGLSGALSELGDSGWGRIVLWVVALGMFLFAAFSLVEARLRRAT